MSNHQSRYGELMSVYILKIIGIAIVTGVMAIAGVFYLGASKLEKEIESENRGAEE